MSAPDMIAAKVLSPRALIRLEAVEKRYQGQSTAQASLKATDLTIAKGERIGVVGRSGSGKSTLLNILAALVAPTAGSYEFEGEPVGGAEVNAPDAVRVRRRVGFVSQASQLLGNFDALGNVRLAAACRGRVVNDEEAGGWLERVGLAHRAKARPSELSGGERQRVNIARALICKPLVLLADEPTGELDLHTSRRILGLMHALTEDVGAALVLVTHAPEYAAECGRQLCLEDGWLRHDERAMRRDTLEAFIEREPVV